MPQTSTVRASGDGPVTRVWTLLAAPGCWPAWAPHMTHVSAPRTGDAPGWVAVGQELVIHTVAPLVRVPVVVTDVQEGRSWRMDARLPFGTMTSEHAVTPVTGGSRIAVSLTWDGPPLLGTALLRSYQPLARHSVKRLMALATDAPAHQQLTTRPVTRTP